MIIAPADTHLKQRNKPHHSFVLHPTPFCSQRTNRNRANQRESILNNAFASCLPADATKKSRRSLRCIPETARIENAHSAALALNDPLLLQVAEQLVDGLAAERKYRPQPLLRDAHVAGRLGLALAVAFEQVDKAPRQSNPRRFE